MPLFNRSQLTLIKPPVSSAPLCGACGLHKTCKSPKMKPYGRGERKILIVGEAPGEQEDDAGRPFVGRSGQYLRGVLDRLDVDPDNDCVFTNSLICRPPGNKVESDKQIDYCRPNVLKVIREYSPSVIIPLGGTAVKSVIKYLWDDGKAMGITRWAGWDIPCRRWNAWVCPSFHPSYLLRQESEVLDGIFYRQMKAAVSHDAPPYPDGFVPYDERVQCVFDTQRAVEKIESITDGLCAFDLETTTSKPDGPNARIVCCSFYRPGKKAFAYPWNAATAEATFKVLHNPKVRKIGANCFSGDTKFLTQEYGTVSFGEVVGKQVTVLNHEGRWVAATIHSFGVQETVDVSFVRRNYRKTVRCTLDHEWISAEDGTRIKTRNLRKRKYRGSVSVPATPVPFQTVTKTVDSPKEYLKGVRHGIVYGDGTKRKDRVGHYRVRLCGGKTELVRFFSGFAWSKPENYHGDIDLHVTGQVTEMKSLPQEGQLSQSYITGFIRGLLATDGFVSKSGQISITGRPELEDWIGRYGEKAGFLLQGVTKIPAGSRNYEGSYHQTQDLVTVYFTRESVQAADLLLSKHRRRYKRVALGPYKYEKTGHTSRREEVFCAVVPDGHSFTLAGGLVTGNCKFEDRWTRKFSGRGVAGWVWDTVLQAHALDCRFGITSVKFQAFVKLGVEDYASHIKPFLESEGGNEANRIREVDTERLLKYCAIDSLVEYELATAQADELGLVLE